MRTQAKLILASLLISAPAVAIAQAPPTPVTPSQATAPPPPQRASECAQMLPSQPRGNTAPGQTTGQAPDSAREPLGDKLAQSDGVLCPPAGVDPEMPAPAPDGGKTPVIPPPGSPGGDPNVRPK